MPVYDFKPFGYDMRMGFQGCEDFSSGDLPHSCETKDCTIILDAHGVSVMYDAPGVDDTEEFFLERDFPCVQDAIKTALLLLPREGINKDFLRGLQDCGQEADYVKGLAFSRR